MHSVQQRLRGAVMEVGGAGAESAQDRSLDLANMVEFAIDQGLAEICCVLQWSVGRGMPNT
jgi:hypothetical protein